MPNDLLALTAEFATTRIVGDAVFATPLVPHDAGSVRNWIDVDRVQELGPAIGREVVRMLEEHPTLSPSDVSFVCDYHHDGVAAVRVIEAAGIPVHHIFSRDPDAPRRRRKHRFWPDVAAVKGCTAHSLKGWQSTAVVLGIGADDRARRLAYVAMTRAVLPDDGSPAFVSVISADRELTEFGTSFVDGSAVAPEAPTVASWTATPRPPPPPAASPVAPAEPFRSPAVPLVAPSTLHGVTAVVPVAPAAGAESFGSPAGSTGPAVMPPPKAEHLHVPASPPLSSAPPSSL